MITQIKKYNLYSITRQKYSCICGYVLVFVFSILSIACSTEKNTIVSPNGKIKVTYNDKQESAFHVFYLDQVNTDSLASIISLEVGLLTSEGGNNMKLTSVSKPQPIIDDYTMLGGKRSECRNEATERIYTFKDSNALRMDVVFRVYNDGIAFRYTFPEANSIVVNKELTSYKINSKSKRWTQKLNTGYEDFYQFNTDGIGNNKDGKWGYPALFETMDSTWLLLTEAGIEKGDCGSWLSNMADKSSYKVQLFNNNLPHPKGWQSPWRIAIIGKLSDIVESTLVTDVSPACRIEDTSWIEPGLVSWIYWAYNHGSKDYQIVKKYIDFAVDMKLPYVLIDWEWDEMSNGGSLQDAISYAKEKKVKPLLWYNSSTAWLGPGPLYRLNSKENREKEFKYLKELGVKGIKVDFFNEDNEETMRYYIDILEDAAKYELMVNFHGATIPRGWQRTYPNMMTAEAVYGAEWYNNNKVLTNRAAAHNATLPFTRNVIGSMDYTPCTFTDSQHPHITSDAHELALLVLFESSLQHLADRPEGYLSQPLPVQSLISNLPVAWDETKFLSGYPGVEIVMARRKNNVWYVAGINGTNEDRSLSFSPSMFSNTAKELIVFKDEKNGENLIVEDTILITDKSSSYKIDCLPRGGFVAVIK